MRIGLFTEVYKPYISGVATSVAMLKKSLEKMGHKVYVVTINLETMKYEYDEKERVLRVPGVDTGIYESLKVSSIYPVKSTNIIKKWKLDIIHTHTEGSIGSYGRLLAKQFDIPVIHTYHTMYGDYAYKISNGKFTKITDMILGYASRFMCDTTISELIVPSKKAYDLFKEKYKIERTVHIIPNGVEIDRFFKEKQDKKELIDLKNKYNIKYNDFVMIYLGRVSEVKNIDFLIEAHRKIVRKCKNAKLMIVGDGPDLEKLKRMTNKYKLEDNIIFTGMVNWDDVPKYYNIGNVFTTASFTENHSMTVIEAMAASLPLVVAEDIGVCFAVVEDLNGYIFKDKNKYIKIIEDLYNDTARLNRLSNQARLSSLPYSDRHYAEKVLDVYSIACNNDKKSSISKIIDKLKRKNRN